MNLLRRILAGLLLRLGVALGLAWGAWGRWA